MLLDLISALQNRGFHTPLFGPRCNKALLLAVTVSFLVQLSLIYVPFMQAVFQTEALSLRDLSVLLFLAGGSMSLHEMRRTWERTDAMAKANREMV